MEKGNIRAAPFETLSCFILKAWDAVKTDSVLKELKKCGISNAMDGIEDDCQWQTDDRGSESKNMKNDKEWDPYIINDKICQMMF